MADNFLGTATWNPNGFVDARDEAVQQHFIANALVWPATFYAYHFPFNGRQNGDESFGGNSYQYIPTEIEVGAAVAMRNMASAGELPVQTNDPGATQLLQSMYAKMSQFWQEIRNASGTGWGS